MDFSLDSARGHSSIPPDMRSVVLDRFGGRDELELRLMPVPPHGDNDVLIRVEVAGVGSWDAIEREGGYDGIFGVASTFPYVLGWDGAGTVAAVGQNVTRFSVGDRVYAATMPIPRGGFYAEYAVVDAEHVASVPARLSLQEAGVMAWDALTALSGLDLLNLRAGSTLMVFGASGGIGHLAVQFARHRGLSVFAVASGDDGVALARRSGATAVDGRAGDVLDAASQFAPQGIDAALVTAGGTNAERALRAVSPSGRIAWPHGVDPMPSSPPVAPVINFDGDRSRAATDRLNGIIEVSDVQPHVGAVFALESVTDAHAALEKHHLGKLALHLG